MPRAGDLVITQWSARFRGRRFPCVTGHGGIGHKPGEGDGITPLGTFQIIEILARPDRFRHDFPVTYRPVGLTDGWSDDPRDPAYNRAVVLPHRYSAEPLRRPDPLYDLIAVLDFNRSPTVPGKGSAIFLHVWRKPRHPTAGCVAFRRSDLAWILGHWTTGSRVVIR
jgi:L,D-peptidoglycan transpeptidase YkuD (ErfK/YbiS/YcfS/YnhG family)